MGNMRELLVKALKDYWDEMFNLMLCNIIWLLAQLLIVTGPPATIALFHVAHRVAHGHFARVSDMMTGFRQNLLTGWKWGGLNLIVVAVLGYGILFYGSADFPQPYGLALMWVNLFLLFLWLFTQLYAIPFWLEQVDKRMTVALRNALVTQAQNLRVTLVVALLAALAIALTVALPPLVAIVTPAFLVVLGSTVVAEQVKVIRGDET